MSLGVHFPKWISEVNSVAEGLAATSLALALVTVVSFLIFPERRRFPTRLPMYINVAGAGLAFFSLLSSEGACKAQAIGIYYFGTACWVSRCACLCVCVW